MRKTFATLIILGLVIASTGCATIQTPEGRLDRDRVVQGLNNAELIFNVGLTFAELRGADAVKIAQIRTTSTIAFALVRDALALNLRDTKPEDLGAALLRLRVAVNDALLLCDTVGVSPDVMAQIRIQIDRAFVVLEALTERLYTYNAAKQELHKFLVVLAANLEG